VPFFFRRPAYPPPLRCRHGPPAADQQPRQASVPRSVRDRPIDRLIGTPAAIVRAVSGRRAVLSFAPALVAFAAAVAVLAWPVEGNGVAGNALRPHYSDFGWFAYAPLPPNPSKAQLREAGVPVPQDVVTHRRRAASAAAAVGLVLLGSSLVRVRGRGRGRARSSPPRRR
jgi:hypothetical protein